jgi:hypothetical protein
MGEEEVGLTRKNAMIIPMTAIPPMAPTTPPTMAPVAIPPDGAASVELGPPVAMPRPSVKLVVGVVKELGGAANELLARISVVPACDMFHKFLLSALTRRITYGVHWGA